MPAPVLESVAQRLYDGVAPLAYDDARQNYALANYLGAAGGTLQVVDDYSRDQVVGGKILPGWSQLVDIDRCPPEALAWLGQFVGVTLPGGLSEADQRTQIESTGGWKRGTPAAIMAAPLPYLTGTKTVILRERLGGDPYAFQVLTKYSETPPADWPATNYETNSDAKTNTTGYSVTNATLARLITDGPNTGTCFEITATGVGIQFVANSPAPITGAPIAVKTYTCKMLLKGVGGTVGDSVTLQMNANGGAFGNVAIASATFPLTSDWVEHSITGTVDHPDRTALIAFVADSVNSIGEKIRIAGVQFEDSPGPSPTIVTDGSIASRPSGQGKVGAALRAAKPAALLMTYSVIAGNDYQSLLTAHPLYSNIFADYATYQGVLSDAPGT